MLTFIKVLAADSKVVNYDSPTDCSLARAARRRIKSNYLVSCGGDYLRIRNQNYETLELIRFSDEKWDAEKFYKQKNGKLGDVIVKLEIPEKYLKCPQTASS